MNILLIIFAVTVNFEIYQWFNIGSTGFTTNDFITLLFLLAFLKIAIWDGAEFKLAKNPIIKIYLLFLLASFVSGLYPLFSGNSEMINQYMKSIIHFHFTYLVATIIILCKFENSTWENFIKVWLILSLVINVFGIYQMIARAFDLPFAWIELTNASFYNRSQQDVSELTQLSLRFQDFFRATSFFSEPSALGAFNGITLVFTLIPKIKNFKPFLKSEKLNNIIIVFSIIGLFLAFSLTGITIVAVMFLILIFTERLSVVFSMLKVLPFLIILILIANYAVDAYSGISILEMFGKRIGSLSNMLMGKGIFAHGIEGESVVERGNNFISMYHVWVSSPFIGVGLGLIYLSPFADGWAYSDTSFMAVLAEMGIMGILIYLSLFVSFYIMGFRLTIIKSIYEKFDSSYKRLVSLIVYLLSYLVVTNFLSANNLINVNSALFFGLIISFINNYYIDYEKRYYVVKLVNKPLKSYFYK